MKKSVSRVHSLHEFLTRWSTSSDDLTLDPLDARVGVVLSARSPERNARQDEEDDDKEGEEGEEEEEEFKMMSHEERQEKSM